MFTLSRRVFYGALVKAMRVEPVVREHCIRSFWVRVLHSSHLYA
jgi:hypothetical protein